MGFGIGQDANGTTRRVVSTSERRGYLRPGVELKPGEELARGNGHAEVNNINYMNANKITPRAFGAGRPICDNCSDAITSAGAVPATELKKTKRKP
jgi:filamentous hemagglutinin